MSDLSSTILELAHSIRVECVTKEQIRERLAEIENVQGLRMVALDLLESLKPKMSYAGVRPELLDVTIDLVNKTLDLEFLVEQIDKNC